MVASSCLTKKVIPVFTSSREPIQRSTYRRKRVMFTTSPFISSSLMPNFSESLRFMPSSARRMLWKSKNTMRFTLRPPPSLIDIQFWNEPSTRVSGETVSVVLSKLRTFTVVSVMSSTMPFTSVPGTVIQSPL